MISMGGIVVSKSVRVAGDVEGSITARDHLCLERTGGIHGDVATASLVVEDGGCLNGRSTMTKAPEPDPELRTVQDLGDLQFGPGYDVDGE